MVDFEGGGKGKRERWKNLLLYKISFSGET